MILCCLSNNKVAPFSLLLLFVICFDVAASNSDVARVDTRSKPAAARELHIAAPIPFLSYPSPQAAQALSKRLWRVRDVEEHKGLSTFAAQAAEETRIRPRRNYECHHRRIHSSTAADLSCSKCVSLLFLNGTCCCFEANALMTSDNEESEELMATCRR